MDVRLLILAGTFLLLVGSLAVFFWALGRSARERRMRGSVPMPVEGHSGASGPVDTDLRGLILEVSADAPSASLLTPLRTGEWAPPAQPAPAEELAGVSLSERIEAFTPLPDIPEPAFAVQTYAAWEVAPEAGPVAGVPGTEFAGEAAAAPATVSWVEEVAESESPASAPDESTHEPPIMPPITVPSVASRESLAAEGHSDWDEDFEAEIARLLPDGPPAGATPTPLPQSLTEPQPQLAPEPAPEPAPQAAPEPAPQAAPEPAPQAAPEPAPQAAPPVSPPAPPLEPAPASEPGPVPLPQPVAEPEPQPDAAPVGFDFWEGQLREQQGIAVAPAREAAPERPAARVAEAAFVPPVAPVTVPVPPPRPARPVARVHAPDGEVTEYAPTASAHNSTRSAAAGRDSVPELVMAAPVEMWFGDSRVGVKAGTATYERFRKYADVLLADLDQAGGRAS